MSSRYAALSDVQWEQIAPLMPVSAGKLGRPFKDHRLVTEGIIYRYRAGIPWRDLPEHSGAWQTVWKRHRRYSGDGTWDKVLASLLTRADAAGSSVQGSPARDRGHHLPVSGRDPVAGPAGTLRCVADGLETPPPLQRRRDLGQGPCLVADPGRCRRVDQLGSVGRFHGEPCSPAWHQRSAPHRGIYRMTRICSRSLLIMPLAAPGAD